MSEHSPKRKEDRKAKQKRRHGGMDEVSDLLSRQQRPDSIVAAPPVEVLGTELKESTLAPADTEREASVPVMITHKMHSGLEDLGYSAEHRGKLTPQAAWDILKSKSRYKAPEQQEKELTLESIYPDGIPPHVLEVYQRLGKEKKKSYLEKKAAEERSKALIRKVEKKAEEERSAEEAKRSQLSPEGHPQVPIEALQETEVAVNERRQKELLEVMLGGEESRNILLNLEKLKEATERATKFINGLPSLEEQREYSIQFKRIVEEVKRNEAVHKAIADAKKLDLDLSEPPVSEAPSLDIDLSEPQPEISGKESLPAVFRSNRRRSKGSEAEIKPLPPVAGPDYRVEPPFEQESEQRQEPAQEKEGTRAEKYSLLKSAVEKLRGLGEGISERLTKSKNYLNERAAAFGDGIREMAGGSKLSEQATEKAAKLKNYLKGRNTDFAEKAKEFGGIAGENFLKAGEWYRKLPLKYKIGVAGALMGTAVLTGGASSFVTIATSAAMMGQRALGSAGVYALVDGLLEKRIVRKETKGIPRTKMDEWKKRGVSTAAALAIFSGVPGYALKELFDAAGGGHLLELLKDSESAGQVRRDPTLGGDSVHPSGAPASEAVSKPTSELQKAYDQAKQRVIEGRPAGEVATPAPAPEIPSVDIEVKAGKGYEWMMKQVWEDLHKKGLDPSRYAEGSDIRRLLEIQPKDEAGINQLVHKIASDPQHAFFKPDGTSAQVNLGEHMTIDADGNIRLGDSVKAPEGAKVTPPYNPEAPAPRAEASAPPPEAPATPVTAPPPVETVIAQAPEPPAATAPVVEPPPPAKEPMTWKDGSGAAVLDSEGNPVQSRFSEQVLPRAEIPAGSVINSIGLAIPTAESHVYGGADVGHTFVFGGTHGDRMKSILEHLIKKDPRGVVFGADETGAHRVPWHLVEGKVVAGPPIRTTGIFGFGSTLMKPPGPEDLKNLIK